MLPALALSPAAKLLIGLLFLIAALGMGVYLGVEWQEGVEAKEDLKQADETRARMLTRMREDRDSQEKLAADLVRERAGRDQDQRNFNRKLADAEDRDLVETSCPQPIEPIRNSADRTAVAAAQGNAEPASSGEAGAQDSAGPGARLSAIGCGLWNSALLAGFTVEERGQLPADADACAGPVELKDALRNLRENSALLGECRLREKKTQQRLRELGKEG